MIIAIRFWLIIALIWNSYALVGTNLDWLSIHAILVCIIYISIVYYHTLFIFIHIWNFLIFFNYFKVLLLRIWKVFIDFNILSLWIILDLVNFILRLIERLWIINLLHLKFKLIVLLQLTIIVHNRHRNWRFK